LDTGKKYHWFPGFDDVNEKRVMIFNMSCLWCTNLIYSQMVFEEKWLMIRLLIGNIKNGRNQWVSYFIAACYWKIYLNSESTLKSNVGMLEEMYLEAKMRQNCRTHVSVPLMFAIFWKEWG
jgi:hypothetical protein